MENIKTDSNIKKHKTQSNKRKNKDRRYDNQDQSHNNINNNNRLTPLGKSQKNLFINDNKIKVNNSNKKTRLIYRKRLILSKFSKIDRFTRRISSLSNFAQSENRNEDNKNMSTKVFNGLSYAYKSFLLNNILGKQLIYIKLLKTLTHSNNVFNSSLLETVKILLSKLYNKKTILNITNLKYLYLNTDIYMQAIAIKLKNNRKNKLNKVLRKALTVIKISRFNPYIRNENNPATIYINRVYTQYKQLCNIFVRPTVSNIKINTNGVRNIRETKYSYTPTNVKGLSQTHLPIINLIKHKSVYGLKLVAAGRLSKRSTASRAVYKTRHKGGLKNDFNITNNKYPALLGSGLLSNLQYTKISSKTRNGAYGVKG